MPYRTARTECRVHLVMLRHLPATTLAHCQTLRQEAGRLWTGLVAMHAQARLAGQWLQAGELEKATKGGQFALGSQTAQALCQKLAATIATTPPSSAGRRAAATGRIQTECPRHPKPSQTVIGKDQGVVWDRPGGIGLKNGQGSPYLSLPVPDCYWGTSGGTSGGTSVRRVELLWRADHYELALTLEPGQACAPCQRQQATGTGIDLGEVHVAASTTTNGARRSSSRGGSSVRGSSGATSVMPASAKSWTAARRAPAGVNAC